MSQSQKSFALNDPLLEDSTGENFLLRRLAEHGHPVFVMDLNPADRITHYRKTILDGGLEATIIGRAPDRKPETYSAIFERLFSEKLTTKRKRNGHDLES